MRERKTDSIVYISFKKLLLVIYNLLVVVGEDDTPPKNAI